MVTGNCETVMVDLSCKVASRACRLVEKAHWKCLSCCLAFVLQGLAKFQTQSRTTARPGCLRPQDQPRANTLPGAAYRTTLESVQDSFRLPLAGLSCRLMMCLASECQSQSSQPRHAAFGFERVFFDVGKLRRNESSLNKNR